MQSFNDILFWHENILKMDQLKQVYLTKFTEDARKTSAPGHLPSAVKTEIPDYTSPGRNRIKNTPLYFTLTYLFHLA